jgi:hypothetical protein
MPLFEASCKHTIPVCSHDTEAWDTELAVVTTSLPPLGYRGYKPTQEKA